MKRCVCAAVALLLGALGSRGQPPLSGSARAREAPHKPPCESAEIYRFYHNHLMGSEQFVQECESCKQRPCCAPGFPLKGVCFVTALATAYLLLRCFTFLSNSKVSTAKRLLSAADGDESGDSCGPADSLQSRLQTLQQSLVQLHTQASSDAQEQLEILLAGSGQSGSMTDEEQSDVDEAIKRLQGLMSTAEEAVTAASGFSESLQEDTDSLSQKLRELPPGAPKPPAVQQLAADIESDLGALHGYCKDAESAIKELQAASGSPTQYGWFLLKMADQETNEQQQPTSETVAAAVVAASIVLGGTPPELQVTCPKAKRQLGAIADRTHSELEHWRELLGSPTFLGGPSHMVTVQLGSASGTARRGRRVALGMKTLQMPEQAEQLEAGCKLLEAQVSSARQQHEDRRKQEQETLRRRRERMQRHEKALTAQWDAESITEQILVVVGSARGAASRGPSGTYGDRTEAEGIYLKLASCMSTAGELDKELLQGTEAGKNLEEALKAADDEMQKLKDFLRGIWADIMETLTQATVSATQALQTACAQLGAEAGGSEDAAEKAPPPPSASDGAPSVFPPSEEKILRGMERLLTTVGGVQKQKERLDGLLKAHPPHKSLTEKLKDLDEALSVALGTGQTTTELLLQTWIGSVDEALGAEAAAKEELKAAQKNEQDKKSGSKEERLQATNERARQQEVVDEATKRRRRESHKVVVGASIFIGFSLPTSAVEALQSTAAAARAPLVPGHFTIPSLRKAPQVGIPEEIEIPRTKHIKLPSQPSPDLPTTGGPVHPPAAAGPSDAGLPHPPPSGPLVKKFGKGVADGEKDPLGSVSSLLSLLGNGPVDDGDSVLDFMGDGVSESEKKMEEMVVGGAASAAAAAALGGTSSGTKGRKRRESPFGTGSRWRKPSVKSGKKDKTGLSEGDKPADKDTEHLPSRGSQTSGVPKGSEGQGTQKGKKKSSDKGVKRSSSFGGPLGGNTPSLESMKKASSCEGGLPVGDPAEAPKSRRQSMLKVFVGAFGGTPKRAGSLPRLRTPAAQPTAPTGVALTETEGAPSGAPPDEAGGAPRERTSASGGPCEEGETEKQKTQEPQQPADTDETKGRSKRKGSKKVPKPGKD
ncbi:hypothetical protein, conserved [Eimeria acervulina]|uniref:Myosin heavy chain n=1 Tax=Eimeria acervulina TaxID=5801 RepID=U6GCX0_EIMAC|nr:hypothetical protein, conserved [Eimeria acervulina]CDI77173.1 hypothetical protein, conserved [Eimeria acervulina]